jgi:hypothetical protein
LFGELYCDKKKMLATSQGFFARMLAKQKVFALG